MLALKCADRRRGVIEGGGGALEEGVISERQAQPGLNVNQA